MAKSVGMGEMTKLSTIVEPKLYEKLYIKCVIHHLIFFNSPFNWSQRDKKKLIKGFEKEDQNSCEDPRGRLKLFLEDQW